MSDHRTNSQPTLTDPQWRELCSQLRATDDISFKLLGFVPLISLAGISVVFFKGEAKSHPALALFCLLGAVTTLGFWIWERRNIQTCLWLRERAAAYERAVFGDHYIGQFNRFPKQPGGLGKTQAEKLVYFSTFATWLIVPWASLRDAEPQSVELLLYLGTQLIIAAFGVREFRARVKYEPSGMLEREA